MAAMGYGLLYMLLLLASSRLTSGCDALVYKRMAKYGWKRPLLVIKLSDLEVYRSYWRVASKEQWSRLPCVGIVLGMRLSLAFGIRALAVLPH